MLSVALAIVSLVVVSAAAPLELALTVGSHMVLQRGAPTSALWGLATPAAVVTAKTMGGCASAASVNATAGADGVWRALFKPMAACAKPMAFNFTSPGAADVSIDDVLVGDVLLFSGQSNMALSLSMALNASEEIAAVDAFGAAVRVFEIDTASAPAPSRDLTTVPRIAWARASGALLNGSGFDGFSATAWLTGRDVYQSGGSLIPVGIIEASVGGTAIRQWCPTAALAICPQPYNSPEPYGTGPYEHSGHFNAMIAPLTTGPVALAGAVWDQAESDSFNQTPLGYYGCQSIAQVAAWRAAFAAPTLPWAFVHLQPYTGSGPCCLAELRAAQLAPLALPAVGVASAIDLGDADSPAGNVHFRDKQRISARLAAVVGALMEGRGAAAPPSFLSQIAYYDAGAARAEVDVTLAAGTGAAAALSLRDAPPCPSVATGNCSTFALLAVDGTSVPATATLDAAAGVLTLSAAMPPGGVYAVGSAYAWSAWPLASLYGGDLPVLPWAQALTLGGPPGPRPPTTAAKP